MASADKHRQVLCAGMRMKLSWTITEVDLDAGSIASVAQAGQQRESDIQDGTMPEPPNAATQECVHISQFH